MGELEPLFTLRVRLADLIELADEDRERGEGTRGVSCVDFLLAALRHDTCGDNRTFVTVDL